MNFILIFLLVLGARIKERRIVLKLTRDKLAHMAHISDKFLYDIEVGNKGMSAETLYKIAQALDVSADWLLDAYININTFKHDQE